MDVFGNLNFPIISISYAAKPDSVLSLFAARYSFFKKPFRIDHIEEPVLKAAYTNTCLTPTTDFRLYATAFLICPVFYLLFTSKYTICKSYN